MEDTTRIKILKILQKTDNPMTLNEISKKNKQIIPKSTASECLDSLTKEGAVIRKTSPNHAGQPTFELNLENEVIRLLFKEIDYKDYADVKNTILAITHQKLFDWFSNVVFKKSNKTFDYPYRRLFTERIQEIYADFNKQSPDKAKKIQKEILILLKNKKLIQI